MNLSAPELRRRSLVLGGLALPLAAWLPGTARAAAFPDKPIKFVVPFNPGGNVDAVARLLGVALGAELQQKIVVDNRAGAGGSLGAGVVAQGPADGYTLLVGSNGPLTINPFVQSKLNYRPLEDFAPIVLAGTVPHALVINHNVAAKNLQELIALSKRQPLGCATSGVGSSTHLTLARFDAQTGAKLEHVPYRGGNSLVPDLLGGAVPAALMELSTALPLHKGGLARVIAMAGEQRSPLAPDVPTFIESGVAGFTAESYVGLLAPAKTPKEALAILEKAGVAAVGSAEAAARMQAIGVQVADASQRSAAGFARLLQAEYERSRNAVKLAGITPE